MKREFRNLTDRIIEGAIHFAEGDEHVWWDRKVHGLRIRIGKRRHTWSFFRQSRFRGDRKTIARRLGFFPTMRINDARKAALALAGYMAEGKPVVGKRDAITLEKAAADYVEKLRTKGKKSARRVERQIALHLLPEFGRFTLAELSDSPALIRDHHRKLSRDKPVGANRVAAILSAIYRHAARLDRSLPPASPISGVEKNKEEAAQTAMKFSDFPAWREAVDALPPIRVSYYRLLLLTGMRGAEAQGLRWSDVNLRARTITLRGTKTGKDVSIPITAAIVSALKLARPMHDGLIYPGARKWADDLPAKGHSLRHSFISTAHDIGVNEIHVRLLVGHSLTGVHASYLTQMVMEGGPGLKASQRRISRRIVELLQSKV